MSKSSRVLLIAVLLGSTAGVSAQGFTYVTTDSPVAIPDNTGTFVACQSIEVPDDFVIGTLVVNVAIDHSYVGDLTIDLTWHSTDPWSGGPYQSLSLTLLNRPGRHDDETAGQSDDLSASTPIRYADDAPSGLSAEQMGAACDGVIGETPGCPDNYWPAPDGSETPIAGQGYALDDFRGTRIGGTWTLCVADSAGADVGTLVSWSLEATCDGHLNPRAAIHTGAAQSAATWLEVDDACSWFASPTEPWIHVTSATSGSGTAQITYALDANTGDSRAGSLSVAGMTFPIVQSGPDACPRMVGRWDGGPFVTGVAVSGSRAYAATLQGSFVTLDVSDPAHPLQIGETDLALGGFWGNGSGGIRLGGSTAWVWSLEQSSVWAVDISSATPQVAGLFFAGERGVDGLDVSGSTACVVHGGFLETVDVSNPSDVESQGLFGYESSSFLDVDLQGDIAYLAAAGAGGLAVVDVGAPAQPFEIGRTLFLPDGSDANQIVVDGDRAYLTYRSYHSSQLNGMAVVDVSSPGQPTALGTLTFPSSDPDELAVWQDMVLLAEEPGVALTVIDVSDPSNPHHTDSHELPSFGTWNIYQLAVGGDYLYAASPTLGLLVFDLTSCGGCAYSLTPATASFSASGGSGAATIGASATWCPWTATSDVAWIHVAGASSGAGNATLSFTVDANPGTATRTGRLRVADQVLTVQQAGQPVQLSFSWSPTSPAIGELVTFHVSGVTAPDAVTWDFGAPGCSGYPQITTCTPIYTNCLDMVHRYAAAGAVTVSLTVEAGGSTHGPVTRTLTVQNAGGCSAPVASFTFSPTTPEVGETVQFTDASSGGPTAWSWRFGDGTTSSQANPGHVYSSAGSYVVSLTVSNGIGSATTTRAVTVHEPAPTIDFDFAPTTPGLGDAVVFSLHTEGGRASAVEWDFAAPGCVGSPQRATCTTTGTGCDHWTHRFARSGTHQVSVVATVDGITLPPVSHDVVVVDSGSCGIGAACGDSRCDRVETALSCPADCASVCGNAACELGENPWSCATDCQPVCGNTQCEPGETVTVCPDDCPRPPDSTGIVAERCRNCLVPAAAGNQPGRNGTVWSGEAMLSNLDATAPLVCWAVYTSDRPDGKTASIESEPVSLEPGQTLYFGSFLEDLFGVSGDSGNVRVWSDLPMAVTTRIFNTGADGETYGQGLPAADASTILSPGQMAILAGLEQSLDFRSNVIVQEVSGVAATVRVEVTDPFLGSVAQSSFSMEPRRSLNLNLSSNLGVASLREGYVTVRISAGGQVAVVGSVIDQHTGDPVTIKPIILGRTPRAAAPGEVHTLVPVVARGSGLAGTVWRSRLVLLNPEGQQQVRMEFHRTDGSPPVTRTVTLGGRGMLVDGDIVRTLLGDAQAQGTLHVYSESELVVDSVTRNVTATGTFGDGLPGLRSGDLLAAGEVGFLELLESSERFRTNVGFAALGPTDAEVELVLFRIVDSDPVAVASTVMTIPAMRNRQVNRAFEILGAGQARPAKAAIRVLSGGPVYAYASKVDNATGDSTNIVAVPQR